MDADGVSRADGYLADELIGSLRADGIAVQDGFLSVSHLGALIECARVRRERGEFVPARIGAGSALQRRADIRGDSIRWLEEPLFAAEREMLLKLQETRTSLNRALYLGLDELEQHYACYPAGSRYERHVDQPRGRGARRLSSVVYLNERWRKTDGGSLRCVADGGEPRDIEPQGGRLVLFLTEGREHEVLPAGRERLSVTGWFLGPQEFRLR